MGATKTIDELNDVLGQFSNQIEQIRTQPAEVEKKFNQAAIAMSAAEGGSVFGIIGAAVGAAYGSMTEDDMTGYLQDHKEEIKKKIQELLEKLQNAVDGLKAPVAFLQTSEDWLKLKSKIGEAQNNELVNGSLTGYWAGAAALKYTAARTLQDATMDTAKSICDKLNESLAAVSNSAWDFYSVIVKDIAGFLVDFAAALGKIATGVAAPFGISDAIDLLAKIIKNAIDYSKKLGDALIAERQNINKITSATDNAKGFKNDRWPVSRSDAFNINSTNSAEWQAT
ncbi:hypothetical protein ACIBJI_31740 [Nocardia sp. NPDC050408]|jgi:prefoldin subunit 5|uniref:hypothetical protein n=1 Tax=Nocardia sp. NPDC050408 TaxID=3364319 RepID=UPI003796EA5D